MPSATASNPITIRESEAVLASFSRDIVIQEVYEAFCEKYKKLNQKFGKEQYLVPYLMSSHPGSTLNDAITLALYLKKNKIVPEQVQDFYPTPGTLSTAMYYTGIDPRTKEKVYVPKTPHEKAMQRALMQYRLPQNYDLVYEALKLVHREDLIGFGPHCLIRPRQIAQKQNAKKVAGGAGKTNGKTAGRTGGKQASAKKKTIRNVHKKK